LDADYRQLIEGIPAGVVIVRDGVILYVNETTLRWFGMTVLSQAVGRNVLEFVHVDDREAAMARLSALTGSDRTDPTDEYRGVRADGEIIYLEMSSVPIEFEGAPAILLVANDVTSRRRLRAQLVRADRMASLGILSAGIAHEINSPLTHVVFGLSCMAKELERSPGGLSAEAVERLAQQVATAREGAGRVAAIARDLRAFSRPDDRSAEVIDVGPVLHAAVNLARVEIEQRARLERDYAQTGSVAATATQLAQVFLNLLTNAAQSFRVADLATNRVTVRTRVDHGVLAIEVADTGEGIPRERISRIFEPFFTTKPGVGVGLGLWICQSTVAELGGKIEVDSAPGRGATFRVTLPVVATAS